MNGFRFESTSKLGLNMAGAAVIIPDSSDGTDPENPYGDGNNNELYLKHKCILVSLFSDNAAPPPTNF